MEGAGTLDLYGCRHEDSLGGKSPCRVKAERGHRRVAHTGGAGHSGHSGSGFPARRRREFAGMWEVAQARHGRSMSCRVGARAFAERRTPSERRLPRGKCTPTPSVEPLQTGARPASGTTLLPTASKRAVFCGNNSLTRVRRVVVAKPSQINNLRVKARERLFCTAPSMAA